ncbi:phage portal protein [Atrimonas thermophila]
MLRESVFFKFFTRLFTKQSRTFSAIVAQFLGQPIWSPKNYASFAREGYCSNVYVYTCIRMIANACAGIDWYLYRRRGNEIQEVTNHPFNALLQKVNPQQSWSEFIQSVVSYLMIAGNAYVEVISPRKGIVTELYVLRPDRVKILPGDSINPVRGYKYTVGGKEVTFSSEEILHLKFFNPYNDYYGLSPIEAIARVIDQNNESRAWNVALLQNSARPSGALVANNLLSEQEFERLREQIKELYSGSKNAGKPLLLEGGLDWKPMGYSPAEMEWLEGIKLTAREIAIAFGIPPQMLGDRESSTYSNYQEARKAFYTETVLPLLDWLRGEFNAFLPAKFSNSEGLFLDYDRDDIEALQEDRGELWKNVIEAVKSGILSPNEARELLGYEPKEGADALFMPGNLMPYTSTGEEE